LPHHLQAKGKAQAQALAQKQASINGQESYQLVSHNAAASCKQQLLLLAADPPRPHNGACMQRLATYLCSS
jgi:hypothetical protein